MLSDSHSERAKFGKGASRTIGFVIWRTLSTTATTFTAIRWKEDSWTERLSIAIAPLSPDLSWMHGPQRLKPQDTKSRFGTSKLVPFPFLSGTGRAPEAAIPQINVTRLKSCPSRTRQAV